MRHSNAGKKSIEKIQKMYNRTYRLKGRIAMPNEVMWSSKERVEWTGRTIAAPTTYRRCDLSLVEQQWEERESPHPGGGCRFRLRPP